MFTQITHDIFSKADSNLVGLGWSQNVSICNMSNKLPGDNSLADLHTMFWVAKAYRFNNVLLQDNQESFHLHVCTSLMVNLDSTDF